MFTFIILGYGVPKNILKDENYGRYLNAAFNYVYDVAAGEKARVIFSGGRTDCFRPFNRTEAGEMVKLFKKLAGRKTVKAATKKWEYVLEQKSISGLENHLYTKGLCHSRVGGNPGRRSVTVYIFSEHTRARRNAILAKKVFKGFKTKIIGIDFDVSPTRYIDKKFLADKERQALKMELLALKDKNKLKEYIRYHKNKLEFFHAHLGDPKASEKWWRIAFNN